MYIYIYVCKYYFARSGTSPVVMATRRRGVSYYFFFAARLRAIVRPSGSSCVRAYVQCICTIGVDRFLSPRSVEPRRLHDQNDRPRKSSVPSAADILRLVFGFGPFFFASGMTRGWTKTKTALLRRFTSDEKLNASARISKNPIDNFSVR